MIKENKEFTEKRAKLNSGKSKLITINKFGQNDAGEYDYRACDNIHCNRLINIAYNEDSIVISYQDWALTGYQNKTYIITEDIDLIKIEVQ